jgi:hypothetical protein
LDEASRVASTTRASSDAESDAVTGWIRARLANLQRELLAGRAELQEIEARRSQLHETVLRITGAIQVLEELHAHHEGAHADRVEH